MENYCQDITTSLNMMFTIQDNGQLESHRDLDRLYLLMAPFLKVGLGKEFVQDLTVCTS